MNHPETVCNRSDRSRTATLLIAFAAAMVFVSVAVFLAFARGVCCADDAYLAVVAKNLAAGHGYTSSIQPFASSFRWQPFDPLVGTGPTVILPAAASIVLVGATPWAPGLANVVSWSSLLALLLVGLHKRYPGARTGPFSVAFVSLCYALTTFHFEHWFALLGEAPAAFLLLLSLVHVTHSTKPRHQFAAGACLSAAVHAKLLSALALPAVVLALLYLALREERNRKRAIFLALVSFGTGLLAPFLLFESWKIAALGLDGYQDHWHRYLAYITTDGARLYGSTSIWHLYLERTALLADRFGLRLPLVMVALLGGWFLIRDHEPSRLLFVSTVGVAASYLTWWLFLSNGWPRYFVIAIIVLSCALSLPLLTAQRPQYSFLYATLLVLVTVGTWSRLEFPIAAARREIAAERPNNLTSARDLRAASDAAFACTRSYPGPIATQWWATAADLEYTMASGLNFTSFHDRVFDRDSTFCLAMNTRFMDASDRDFVDLVQSCDNRREYGPYVVARCHGASAGQ